MNQRSRISPILFVLCIVSFFFTFVEISCQGQKVVSLSGIQLATGTSVDQPQMFGPAKKEKIAMEPFALLALLAAIAGAAVFFMAAAMKEKISAIAGAVGAICLLITHSRLDDEIVKRGQGMFQVSFGMGYSLALLLFLAATAWNGYVWYQSMARPAPPVPSPGA